MKVLITGGTGSLGRALIRIIKMRLKWDIICYSRDEGKQAKLYGNDPDVLRVIGDVRDFKKLDKTMKLHKPDYVIHTAALKRIDDLEYYPDECVKTNINGSENVAQAAFNNGVKKCILISTDKATMPVNVYGSTKFIAERIYTNFDYNSDSTIFSSIRYGNVLASRGSFIPMWMDLIKDSKPITVTSLECSRFLFTLDDAANSVLSALQHSQGGEIFIPKIDSFKMETIIEAIKTIVKVDELECNLIGMRPGEKIHEDMLAPTELPYAWEATEKLIAVIPQYTKKTYNYNTKYEGEKMNSAIHVCKNVGKLVSLIHRGLLSAN